VSGSTAPELVTALGDAQRLGFLGARPIADVVAHARGFVRVLRAHGEVETVLDLGSGGGIPGLVVAHDLPELHVTLLDRRAKRTDFLERVVRRLGWTDRVSVICSDVESFLPTDPFDAVVARGFGPPEFTLSAATRLVRAGGPMVISEPPDADRWDEDVLARLGVRRLTTPTSMPTSTAHADDARQGPRSSGDLDGLVAVFVTR
jgi:16S rRNA (guanine527-N7)-methyltransferase